ncbi:hypothetical protein AAII07_30935 [Microvirga sp. 0TCS3.31]
MIKKRRGQLLLNVGSTYGARGTSIVTLLVLFPLVLQSVGPSAFGAYLLVSSTAVLLQSDLGLGSAAVTRIARAMAQNDVAGARAVARSSALIFWSLGALSAVIYLAVFAVGWQHFNLPTGLRSDVRDMALLASMQCLIALGGSVSRQVLTAVGRLDVANYVQIGCALCRILVTIAALSLGATIVGVVLIDTATVSAIAVTMWICRRRVAPQLSGRRGGHRSAALKGMLTLNLSLVAMTLAGTAVMQSPSLILSFKSTVGAVAVFGAAFRVYQLCKEASSALGVALLPNAAQMATDKDSIARLFIDGTRYANALLMSVALPVLLFAEPLLDLWVGSELSDGALAAKLLVLSLLVSNNHLIGFPVMTARGRLRGYATLHLLWAALTIGIGIQLVGAYGPTGMAIAVLAPVVVLEPAYLSLVLRELQIPARTFARSQALPVLLGLTILGVSTATITGAADMEGPAAVVLASALVSFIYATLFWWLDRSRRRSRNYLNSGTSPVDTHEDMAPSNGRSKR